MLNSVHSSRMPTYDTVQHAFRQFVSDKRLQKMMFLLGLLRNFGNVKSLLFCLSTAARTVSAQWVDLLVRAKGCHNFDNFPCSAQIMLSTNMVVFPVKELENLVG